MDDLAPLTECLLGGDALAEDGGEQFVVRDQAPAEPQAGETSLSKLDRRMDCLDVGKVVESPEQTGYGSGDPVGTRTECIDGRRVIHEVGDLDGGRSRRGQSRAPEDVPLGGERGVGVSVPEFEKRPVAQGNRWAGVDEGRVVVAPLRMADVEISHPHEGIALVTLNRPAKLNAMTSGMVEELHDAIAAVGRDRDARVMVLTGAGRGFCAGLDLGGYGTAPGYDWHGGVEKGFAVQKHIASLIPRLRSIPQPVISAVNGPASGGGFALVLGSDIRLAAESARFNAAFIRIGLSACDIGTSWLLPRLVGAARAQELMLTGRLFDAAEASRMGLVVDVVPDDVLLDRAYAKAAEIMQNTPIGVALTKEGMWSALEIPGLQAAIDLENRQQIMATFSADVREMRVAKAEGRTPRFDS